MNGIDKETEKLAEDLVQLAMFTEDALLELLTMYIFLRQKGLLKEYEADNNSAREAKELVKKIYDKLEKE